MIDKPAWLVCSAERAFELFLLENGRFLERTWYGRQFELAHVGVGRALAVGARFPPGNGSGCAAGRDRNVRSRGRVHAGDVAHPPKVESLNLWDGRATVFERSQEGLLERFALLSH